MSKLTKYFLLLLLSISFSSSVINAFINNRSNDEKLTVQTINYEKRASEIGSLVKLKREKWPAFRMR